MKARFFILSFFFAGLYGLLGTNLYRLQIQKSDYYVGKVNAMQERVAALELRRGQIFVTDRAGGSIPLAINKDYPIIFVSPNEVEDEDALISKIPAGLGIDKASFAESLKNKKSSFKLLIEKANDEQIKFITDNQFEGVHIDAKQYRFYPFQSLSSQLLGFVGFTDLQNEPVGLYGMEKMHNDELSEGESIYLTIDRNIQAHAEQLLSELITNFKATGGTIIVEEPSTGKILTMTSKPDFDPNEYARFPLKNFLNPAIQLVYEPGSVMKPITMAIGIETGAITPDTKYKDKGSITLNSRTIHNANDEVYGTITMSEVIMHSVNTGAVFAEQKIGHDTFLSYLEKFGFGERTGIDATDEIGGSLNNLKQKDAKDVDFATASFGQGTSVTPLQLANAFSVLANGGILMRPYINQNSEPYMLRRIISDDTARKVAVMLEATVENAKVAVIPEYRVAGKTGTAYIPDFENGGYSEEMEHTFVGFAPVSDPKFVVVIKLDKPQVGELAGLTVVPAFRDMAEYILNYYHIAPDKLVSSQ